MTENDDTTIFRLGVDVEVHTEDEEICTQHVRIKRIENLEKCKNLKKLALVASAVEEIDGIGENRLMEHLEIYQGLLTRIDNIAHLQFLKILDLSFNNITTMENLSSLVNLEKLYLSNNKISKINGLENLSKLTVLELGANKIRSIEPNALANQTELVELWLGKNKIENMSDLEKFKFLKLKQISLQSNRLTAWSEDFFKNSAPNLSHIYLGDNALPDPSVEVIEGLNSDELEDLDISCNKLTQIPYFPHKLNALVELWLNDNKILSTESFGRLKSGCPNLKTIYLERNPVQVECPLDYRMNLMNNLPQSVEKIDAYLIPSHELRIARTTTHNEPELHKPILKH